jgi:hypothetical protein
MVDRGGGATTIPPEVGGVLGDGEEVRVFTWAQIPLSRLRGTSFASIVALLLIGDQILQKRRRRRLAQGSRDVGFPMDRFMAVLVTDRRLVVWRATKLPRRVREQLSERRLDEIESASLPFVGGGKWRSVVLTTRDGIGVRFAVEREQAGRLVASLGGESSTASSSA